MLARHSTQSEDWRQVSGNRLYAKYPVINTRENYFSSQLNTKTAEDTQTAGLLVHLMAYILDTMDLIHDIISSQDGHHID